jgi:hypothetical protein
MAIRHAAVFIAIPLTLAFGISSPGHAAFWVILTATIAVLLPGIAVVAWLYGDMRRAARGNAKPS